MYYSQQGFAGAAGRRYAAVHAGSRIESASPHGLVKILFDELLLAMDAAALAQDQRDQVKVNDKHSRAMAILHALETSLDFERGGDIAIGLAQIYREARRLMLLSIQNHSSAETRKAREIVGEIADAWAKIG